MRIRRLVDRRVDFGDRAPITEALIDILIHPPEDLDLDALRGFCEPWPNRFPTVKQQNEWASEIHVAPADGQTTVTRHAVRGFSFLTGDEDRVVQARRNGFTLSKLKPYETWEKLQEEAQELWQRYVEVVRPTSVHRIAVRYINRLPFPNREIDLKEWVKMYPTIPDEIGPMAEYLIRSVVTHPDESKYRANITQASLPPGHDRVPSVILDIDVFTRVELTALDEEVWLILEDLREFKNDVFFGTITDTLEKRLLE